MVYSDLGILSMGIDTVYEQDMTAHIIQPAEDGGDRQQFDNIVIVAHGSPDGDAIGATGPWAPWSGARRQLFVLYNATGIPDYLSGSPCPESSSPSPPPHPLRPA